MKTSTRTVVFLDPAEHQEETFFGDVLKRRPSTEPYIGSSIIIREPIGLEYVAGYARSAGYDVILMFQGNRSSETIVRQVVAHNPWVVAISMHTTHLFKHSLDLAARIKTLAPDVTIVVGGYHPSGDPSFVQNPAIDYAVLAEGEETMTRLLDALSQGQPPQALRGLAFKQARGWMSNGRSPRVAFADTGWPLRSAEILRKTRCAPLAYPAPPDQIAAAQVSFSRGCPFNCPYCPSMQIFSREIQYRSVQDTMDEIQYLQETFGTNFLFVTDLTFTVRKKEAEAFCRGILARRIKANWFAYATVPTIERDLLSLMRDAGCSRLGIGIESIHERTLKFGKPNVHYRRVDEIAHALEITDSLGLLVRGYFMVGWPWETPEALFQLGDILRTLPVDQLRLAFVVPFPGTPLNDRYGHLIARPVEFFTGDSAVLNNPSMTLEDQERIVMNMLNSYYSSRDYASRIKSKVERFPHLARSFNYFTAYLAHRSVIPESAILCADANRD